MSDLTTFGQRFGTAQDVVLAEVDAPRLARGRVLAGRPRRPAVVRRRFVTAATLLAAAGAGGWAIVTARAPITFEVAGGGAGRVGHPLESSGSAPLPLRFSDGTEVVLDRSSRAQVLAAHRHGAEVAVEAGGVRVSVRHREDTRWRFHAGPFEVKVVGTRFDLDWAPLAARLSITVHEGAVVVAEKVAGASPLAVVAGHGLAMVRVAGRWEADTWTLLGGSDPAADEPGPAEPGGEEPTPEVVPDAPRPEAAAPKAVRPAVPTAMDWRQLAQVGRYREAFSGASKVGLERLVKVGSPGDLLLLSQAARFSEEVVVAREALLALRDRYPRHSAAPLAAFTLGRISIDNWASPLEAAHWFRAYLTEKPKGELAREAAGRLIEALQRGGDAKGAREAARSYLDEYPDGPHASLARRALEAAGARAP